jgi:hypothetical protein
MPGSLGKAYLLSDYFDHPNILAAKLFIDDGQILRDCGSDVIERFSLGSAL